MSLCVLTRSMVQGWMNELKGMGDKGTGLGNGVVETGSNRT